MDIHVVGALGIHILGVVERESAIQIELVLNRRVVVTVLVFRQNSIGIEQTDIKRAVFVILAQVGNIPTRFAGRVEHIDNTVKENRLGLSRLPSGDSYCKRALRIACRVRRLVDRINAQQYSIHRIHLCIGESQFEGGSQLAFGKVNGGRHLDDIYITLHLDGSTQLLISRTTSYIDRILQRSFGRIDFHNDAALLECNRLGVSCR